MNRGKVLLWTMMIGGVIASGIAFAFKVTEFILTLDSEEVPGFADVPVSVYFMVAGGWFAILCWCFLTGKFRDIERVKFEMLAQEEEYDRVAN